MTKLMKKDENCNNTYTSLVSLGDIGLISPPIKNYQDKKRGDYQISINESIDENSKGLE